MDRSVALTTHEHVVRDMGPGRPNKRAPERPRLWPAVGREAGGLGMTALVDRVPDLLAVLQPQAVLEVHVLQVVA